MIGPILSGVFAIAKGAFKLTRLGIKGAIGLGKMAYKTTKQSIKLAKKVRATIKKSRKVTVMAMQDAKRQVELAKARETHVFNDQTVEQPAFDSLLGAGAHVAAELAQRETFDKKVSEVKIFTK